MTRRRWIALLTVTAVLVLVLGLTARLFVWPTVDRPQSADAIVVLGGDGDRLARGADLVHAGYAPTLVVSIDDPADTPCQDPTKLDLTSVEVICFRPDPFTTRGEARHIADLSRQRGWNHLLVVSNTAQDTRARLRIGRCWPGDLSVVTVPVDFARSVRDVLHEWVAMGKALVLERSC